MKIIYSMQLCGATILSILLKDSTGGGNYVVRNFTHNELQIIGTDVRTVEDHKFRIQAKIADFDKITGNCPTSFFSGSLCYIKYTPPPSSCSSSPLSPYNCDDKNKAIEIVVPITTAIIGVIGGVIAVLLKQHFKSSV
ncbi:hypothetical protein C1645_824963 [Glomus cerebriforme]|uniref:Uncharacterized protein n=1 Tax=Glomus cerebriforme TaxID=658196 RepID=A0A397SWK6_9GLOM|nr:hypothetical protein C1645_824963 [Glomus cerebriforme]